MRMCTLALSLLGVALLSPALAEPVKKADPTKPPESWKDDPVCQMVFFAVLEGLYTDGVSNEAVDRVLGRKARGGAADIKATLVIQCPLCHPVFEAFSLYQQRPTFTGFKGQPDTFGKGLDPSLARGLESENLITRQHALQTLVQRWVERRMTLMRLTEAEKSEWMSRLQARSDQGKTMLTQLRNSDPVYKAWSGYAGCPACDGSTSGCKAAKAAAKKE